MKTSVIGFGLFFAGLAATFAPAAEDAKAEAANAAFARRLAGSYKIVSAESHGKPTPAEKIKDVTVSVTADSIVAIDAAKKEAYAATYTIDASRKPAVIHMLSTLEGTRDATAKGLLQIDGNRVKLIYKLPTGDNDPKTFQTNEGQVMVVLERVAETAAKEAKSK